MRRKIKKIMRVQALMLVLFAIVIVAGFTGFFYYRQTLFSKGNLRLEILGADSAKIGQEIEYTVRYKNNGNFTLEEPRLTFELPRDSLTEDSKTRFVQNLKDIYPGSEDFVKFKGRLIGKEGDLKVFRVQISYRPHNLSARYESQTTFTTKITSVPITLTLDLPSTAEKGKQISYSVNYFSNVDYPLENLSIKIEPLKGFALFSSNPSSLDNVEWKIDTLNKGQGGRIKITGSVLSDAENNLNFAVKLGMWQEGVFITIKETEQDVQIIRPQLSISQQVNGSDSYIASPGEILNYKILLKNNGSSTFDYNMSTVVLLEGVVFEPSSLWSQDGLVQSNINSIVFDSQSLPELQYLAPSQEIAISFSVKLKDDLEAFGSEKNNLVIKNTVNVFDFSQEFAVKISSKIELEQRAYYSLFDGIENEGPVPPEVGRATTYVVNWKVKGYLNDVKNVKIKAFLPQNVNLNDAIFPENQASRFSFDSISREIVWLAGNLAADSQSSLSFQIVLNPVLSQKGDFAQLIGQASASGEDQFTGAIVKGFARAIDTSLSDDQASSGGGIVE